MVRIKQVRVARPPEVVFASTLAIITAFGIYSFVKSRYQYPQLGPRPEKLFARALGEEDLPCRYVHTAFDQCAFVRANCPDEEAGLISYLQLYYCDLQHVKPVAFAIIASWASFLFSSIGIAASDFLCVNLSTIASILGMSESLTGVTFLAFGNGSPDVFSTFAAMSTNSGSLAVGELMGAAGFITAVVAGSMALVKPFRVAKKSFLRDVVFFIVAAGFSLSFLHDGVLKLWECATMVGFYVFYVAFVVVWHWWLQRRRRTQLAETTARLHYHIPEHQELEVPNIEIDEEAAPVTERTALMRSESDSSFPQLSLPGTPSWQVRERDEDEDDDDDQSRGRHLAELQSNMRVRRDTRSRRNTITPIRPSLLGAIEFRSVLGALERRAVTNRPIGLHQYSDDRIRGTTLASSRSHPHFVIDEPHATRPSITANRGRAVSHNAADTIRLQQDLLTGNNGTPETMIYSPIAGDNTTASRLHPQATYNDSRRGSYASNLLASPLTMSTVSGASTPLLTHVHANSLLAPPSVSDFRQSVYFDTDHSPGHQSSPALSPRTDVPELRIPRPEDRKSPLLPQFPPPIDLPPAAYAPGPGHPAGLFEGTDEKLRRYKWWPYAYLPPPQTILAMLFPTICGWRERGAIGRIAGLVTAPTVFLLTITLPVVERKEDDNGSLDVTVMPGDPVQEQPPDSGQLGARLPRSTGDERTRSMRTEPPYSLLSTEQQSSHGVSDCDSADVKGDQHDWNRWLVLIQIVTAPLFVVLVLYANLDESHSGKDLLIYTMSSTVLSLISLLVVVKTSSADRAPVYRPAFCFLGFLVAIAWISTIANEVVGVLKTLGVILNISDAILGLTVFAVGNSLGDLVADITVAKLGFPVMALSACFGGPMLNILLGIGLGGLYMTINREHKWHHKHPDAPARYKPYQLEVSTTLIISGVTLLVTLVGLLVFVPLNKWRMDRKIGIGLITLWALSTVGNVICEVLGYGTAGTIE